MIVHLLGPRRTPWRTQERGRDYDPIVLWVRCLAVLVHSR